MVLASLIRVKTMSKNDTVKMLMPFHHFTSSARSSCSFVFHVDEIIGNGPDRGEIRTRLCDFVVTLPKNFGLRIGSPLVDGVLPSFKHHHIHQLPDEDLEQVRDSGQPIARPSVVRSYFNNSHQFIVDLYNR